MVAFKRASVGMDSTTIFGSGVVTDDTVVESAASSVDVGTATTLWSGVVVEVAVVEYDGTVHAVHASTISIRVEVSVDTSATSSVSVDAAAVERDRDAGSVDVCTTTFPPVWCSIVSLVADEVAVVECNGDVSSIDVRATTASTYPIRDGQPLDDGGAATDFDPAHASIDRSIHASIDDDSGSSLRTDGDILVDHEHGIRVEGASVIASLQHQHVAGICPIICCLECALSTRNDSGLREPARHGLTAPCDCRHVQVGENWFSICRQTEPPLTSHR